jgi:hypothetical protein
MLRRVSQSFGASLYDLLLDWAEKGSVLVDASLAVSPYCVERD